MRKPQSPPVLRNVRDPGGADIAGDRFRNLRDRGGVRQRQEGLGVVWLVHGQDTQGGDAFRQDILDFYSLWGRLMYTCSFQTGICNNGSKDNKRAVFAVYKF